MAQTNEGTGTIGVAEAGERAVAALEGVTVLDLTAHIAKLARLRAEYGRADVPFEVTVNGSASITREEVAPLEAAGVDRIVVTLGRSSRDAIPGLEAFAARVF